MGLILNTNVASLIAQRNLNQNSKAVNASFERLSSGLRINRAADDAAGLNISETLKTQIRGNLKAVANVQDGINVLQIAEGSLSVIAENLQRMRELTIQAANDSNATTERRAIILEVQARIDDINRIAETTKGNNINLLDGSKTSYLLQIGANQDADKNTLNIGSVLSNTRTTAIGITSGLSITAAAGGIYESNTSARNFLNNLDTALDEVFSRRSNIGALQNRLQSTVESLSISIENLQATNSRIRDLDVASESAILTKNQILQQSALSILAQANQAPTLALQLIQ